MHNLKLVFFNACKWLGLFHICRFLYRNKLNVLCYHGFSYEDEHFFRPGLFMTPQTLNKRLSWLARHGYKVFGLSEGLNYLYSDKLPSRSVVITIDDGFRSVAELAAPIFQKYNMPVTLYVTTYYVKKQNPIFRLIMQYMDWKSESRYGALLPVLDNLLNKEQCLAGTDKSPIWQLIDYGENHLNESQRVNLAKQVAEQLNIDYSHISDAGMMTLLTSDEILTLEDRGIDVQLHTHRHTFPEDQEGAEREIVENRNILEPLLKKSMNHFCYPSGVWNFKQWSTLQKLGIQSATTCDPGLNSRSTPPLGLKRFLDNENLPQIEFEAELCGFKELLRNISRCAKKN